MNNQQQEIDTYWNINKVLGEGEIEGKRVLVRMRLHRSTEKYFDDDTLIKLSSHKGERIYVHAKPYILIPDMTLTFATYPRPARDGAIGEVISTDVKKLKPLEIGNAQAWFYPADKALVLWECFLESPYRTARDPRHDPLFTMVWTSFERLLLDQLPSVERIYTTYEPIYERPVFTKFLKKQGFRKEGRIAFVKDVRQPVQEVTSV